MTNFEEILKGGDLRSIGKINEVVQKVADQTDFDALFKGLFQADRKVAMRTADAIEKITLTKPAFLKNHKKEILSLCFQATHIELKWHLALIVPRLSLTATEKSKVWERLTEWATNRKESKIVRVNSIQGLFHLLQQNEALKHDFDLTMNRLIAENVPSLNARIKKIRKQSAKG